MEQRSASLRIALRAAVVVSLIVAALAGAIIATELRPASHVAEARPRIARQPVLAAVAAAPSATATATPAPTATATSIPTPAAPTRAMLAVGSGPALPYGAWISAAQVTLRIRLAASTTATLIPEVEVEPVSAPFTGVPTAQGAPLQVRAGQQPLALVTVSRLADGQRYHWRARVRAANGAASLWSGDGLFGVSRTAPPPPRLVLSSVRLNAWSAVAPVVLRWTDSGSLAPINHFEYALVKDAQSGARTPTWQRAHGSVLALSRPAQGYWHVLVRAVDAAGNQSATVEWSFGMADDAPPAPRIVSADPAQGAVSNVATPAVRWTGGAGVAPLASFEYRLSAGAAPRADEPWIPAAGSRLALSRLSDGTWYVQLRSVDVVGHHSTPTTWSFQLDRARPKLRAVALFSTGFTPPFEKLHLSFTLTKPAAVVYHVVAAGMKTPLVSHSLGLQQPGFKVLTWNGYLAHKKVAPVGAYALVIDVRDAAGNQTTFTTQAVNVLDKRILISISKDALWAYQGNKILMHTLVTNGGPDTPTLPGIFHVLGHYPNFVFHSPFPQGSPLWYPDSPTNYALLYQASGGYFIHDAPWRSVYGPGSNSVAGTPGGNYTGSHGCTNVPLSQMQWLYNWADDGTLVQIVK